MKGGKCEAEDFIVSGEESTRASREALATLIETIAQEGLGNLPSSLCHEVDKKNGIYELIKGRLRLFFFKGANGDVAVCTAGVMKKAQKADKAAVAKAVRLKIEYLAASKSRTIEYICEEDQDEQ